MAGRATILGASGFVGRRLHARLVAEGWDVFAPKRGDAAIFERDLGVVFYCVGLTADYDRRPFDTVGAHVTLLAELTRDGRFERLVYLSSTRLYDRMGAPSVDEAMPLSLNPDDPRHVYDLSKALGENLTLTRTGGRGAVARLSNVFDSEDGSPGFLSEWLIRARSGKDLRLESSPHIARDYIHLDDVVAALLAIARREDPGIVNVACGRLTSNAAIAEVFAAAGWQVGFTRDVDPPAPPRADIGKLIGLGVRPAPVKDVVRRYLEALA